MYFNYFLDSFFSLFLLRSLSLSLSLLGRVSSLWVVALIVVAMGPTALKGLHIEDDDDEVILPNDVPTEDVPNLSFCLVGKFLTERGWLGYGTLWKEFRSRRQGSFPFWILPHLDFQKVTKVGPWTFDKHLLILSVISKGEVPNHIPLLAILPF